MRRLRQLGAALGVLVSLLGCGAGTGEPVSPLEARRRDAKNSEKEDALAHWLLAELYEPEGEAKAAIEARKQLDAAKATGMYAHLARATDDSLHGRLTTAPEHYLRAVQAARTSTDPLAPLLAWHAATQALELAHNAQGLWPRWKGFVEEALERPQHIGWRARGELAEWWADKAYENATENVEERAAQRFGCARNVRLAGPFGDGSAAATLRSYPAEAPGPWPFRFEHSALANGNPRILDDEEYGCRIGAKDAVAEGVFYAETYVELTAPTDILISVQGAVAVWVDDAQVLERNVSDWGTWPRFGTALHLSAGRHRLLARLTEPVTSILLLRSDGVPLPHVTTSEDASAPYTSSAPTRLADANLLMRYVTPTGVRAPGSTLERVLAASMAHEEGQDDLASVLLEPLLKDPGLASGPTLDLAGAFAAGDPLFNTSQAEDLVRELSQRALDKDPELWKPSLAVVTTRADSQGLPDTAAALRELAKRFPEVPALLAALARLYGELGWEPERSAAQKELAQRFPNNPEALYGAVDVYDAAGDHAAADKLAAKIQELDPDSEVALARALVRQDYDTTKAELMRLQKRRPERKDLARRLLDVLELAGESKDTMKRLQEAIAEDPTDGLARLAYADANFAQGDTAALAKALADAVNAGADTGALIEAIDLVAGLTELDRYRVPTLPVIAEYEKSGQHMPGTAARLLDYAAVLVGADGSSRMLEHEIIRIQSEEAIQKFAEHRRLEGLVLNMRVLKKDGRTLEPESVAGKPTVTFPHLEVGDYIETEQIVHIAGEHDVDSYAGPRWFFREEEIAYARSEFLLIAPKYKALDIETTGDVPAPVVTVDGEFVARRWRVDFSPAAPVEPMSAPITEFLPSVRISWGITLAKRLEQLVSAVSDVTPIDPRITRIAENIVAPIPRSKPLERTRRLYHWVLDNIQPGDEVDGRRAIIGKNGNRWRALMMLCRSLNIETTYAIAQNRLAQPAQSPVAEAELYSIPVLVVGPPQTGTWLTVNDKYAPFGYVPVEARGMPAFLLSGQSPVQVAIPEAGAVDRLSFSGSFRLSAAGGARFDLERSFEGKFAAQLRSGLEQVAERQLHDVLEARILGVDLKGARLESYEVKDRDALDKPLVLALRGELLGLAQVSAGSLTFAPPFAPQLAAVASLPKRQTPLLIHHSMDRSIRLEVELPPGARAVLPRPYSARLGDRTVTVKDRQEGSSLILEREISLGAGRIQPEAYAEFAAFVRSADEALNREIQIALRH